MCYVDNWFESLHTFQFDPVNERVLEKEPGMTNILVLLVAIIIMGMGAIKICKLIWMLKKV